MLSQQINKIYLRFRKLTNNISRLSEHHSQSEWHSLYMRMTGEPPEVHMLLGPFVIMEVGSWKRRSEPFQLHGPERPKSTAYPLHTWPRKFNMHCFIWGAAATSKHSLFWNQGHPGGKVWGTTVRTGKWHPGPHIRNVQTSNSVAAVYVDSDFSDSSQGIFIHLFVLKLLHLHTSVHFQMIGGWGCVCGEGGLQMQMLLVPFTSTLLWLRVLCHVYSIPPDLFHYPCLFGFSPNMSFFLPQKLTHCERVNGWLGCMDYTVYNLKIRD